MRKIEMITLFDTDYLVVPNNLLITHSLTHYTLNIRMERRPNEGDATSDIYGFAFGEAVRLFVCIL